MGIQVNGNTNNINAGIGSLSIEDINELDIVGVVTAANFKTGVSNLHNVGLTLSGGQIDVGSNIKIGTAGVVTATSFVGSGANLTGVTALSGSTNNTVCTVTGANAIQGESNLTFDGSTLSVTGAGAFTGNIDLNSDTNKLKIGAGDDFQFFHNGSNNFIETNNGDIRIKTSDGSGNLTFTAGGNTESFRITSTGMVLIGETSVAGGSQKLVVGNGGAENFEFTPATSAQNGGVLEYIHRGDGSTRPDLSMYVGNGAFKVYTGGNNERLRIDSDGRLLVNTTSASISSAEIFEVKSTSNGFSHFRNNHSGYAPIYIDNEYTNTAMAPLITITDGGGNRAGLLLDPNSVFDITGQGAVSFSTGGTVGNATEKLRITSSGKIGINNTSPECRTGGIDASSNDSTSGRVFTDLRGHSSLILRNPNTTQHSFTQLLFENGGATSAATMLRHRLGSSRGSLQNFVGDLCLFRRTGNAGGSNADYRESTRWCGSSEQARQIWWAAGSSDTSDTSRLGWHHLSAQRDHPGTDAYSFFRLETGAASYARQGMGKYTVVWTTGHASGYGLQIGHFGYYMHHTNNRIYVNEHIIYRERYSNGSYYGWNDNPEMRIINNSTSGGTNACISFRCGGRRYSGFDMGVVVGLFIDLYVPESANGDSNPRLYVAGNSESNLDGGGFGTPVSHSYCSFQSSNPNHSGQP